MSKVWDVPHLKTGSERPVMDPDQVYVYNMRYCPYAQRAMLTLLAKKVDFKVFNINLKQKPDWFVNETFGKVPVLLYKGEIIPESLIVSDYADELFPGPQQHPSDPTQKAKDRVLLEIFNRVIMSYYKLMLSKEEEAKETALKDFCKNLDVITEDLKKRGSKFFCGETPGMLDWMVWPWIERFPVLEKLGITMPENAALQQYMDNMWETDPVKEYGLKPEVHYEFLKQYTSGQEEIDYDFMLNK
eukprot:TRINITY_DN31833_c0_g1_i1.p1 TRINITY_DN31833_c0_g1~~TRINITY_DN31833_c0_g1_i1.p1  ORF type:complete len:253 (-),score=52.14 TRINITY_DN31833_c0_g1_i1:63-794(-)